MSIGYMEVPSSDVPALPTQLFFSSTLGAARLSSALQVSGTAPPPNVMGFPRTHIYAIGGNQQMTPTPYSGQVSGNVISTAGYFSTSTFNSNAPCAWAGRYDVAVIDLNWENPGSAYDRGLMVDAIRQIRNITGYLPTEVAQYDLIEGMPGSGNPYPTLESTVNSELWWLYTSANESGSIGQSFFGTGINETNWAINLSTDQSYSTHRLTANYDGSQEDWPQHAAAYFCELHFCRHSSLTTVTDGTIAASSYTDPRFSFADYQKAPNLSATYIDNMLFYPRTTGYYDLTSQYSNGNLTVGQWLYRGNQHLFKRFGQIMALAYPSRTYLKYGNFSSAVPTYASNQTQFKATFGEIAAYVNGGLLELEFSGGLLTWTDDNYYSFDTILATYQYLCANCVAPGLVAITALVSSNTDWQGMRFCLGFALLGNGLAGFTTSQGYGVNDYPWPDEAGGNPGTNVPVWWLGQPKDSGSGPTAPAINGAWVRDFTNGTVIVNPFDASGAVSITPAQLNNYLGKSYTFKYIQGSQNPSLNSGATFGGATIQKRDALFLKH